MLVTALLFVLTVLSHVRVSAEVHGGTILALKGKKSVVNYWKTTGWAKKRRKLREKLLEAKGYAVIFTIPQRL